MSKIILYLFILSHTFFISEIKSESESLQKSKPKELIYKAVCLDNNKIHLLFYSFENIEASSNYSSFKLDVLYDENEKKEIQCRTMGLITIKMPSIIEYVCDRGGTESDNIKLSKLPPLNCAIKFSNWPSKITLIPKSSQESCSFDDIKATGLVISSASERSCDSDDCVFALKGRINRGVKERQNFNVRIAIGNKVRKKARCELFGNSLRGVVSVNCRYFNEEDEEGGEGKEIRVFSGVGSYEEGGERYDLVLLGNGEIEEKRCGSGE